MTDRAIVPCDGCTACCRGQLILCRPGDDPSLDWTTINGVRALRHNPDQSCVYLGPHGCTIHSRAPTMCQIFDCRRYAASVLAGLTHTPEGPNPVLREGQRRMHTLNPPKAHKPRIKPRRTRPAIAVTNL